MPEDQSLKLSIGKLLANTLTYRNALADVEFSIFSQFGDDGIIQFLLKEVQPSGHFFVEFGVENFLESNTRFLLQNNNWSGLVMDGSKTNVDFIKKQDFYWRHDLEAKDAFITAENINELLSTVPAKIGLLHIDVDGNDYWLWKAITATEADIVIMEYNSVFGAERAITIPYEASFVRQQKHYSYLYAGASLAALCDLAAIKGYSFIGSNSAGNNAYFVKNEKIGSLKPLTAAEGYVESKFRESRNKDGQLDFKRGGERMEVIKGMLVYNTRTNEIEKL